MKYGEPHECKHGKAFQQQFHCVQSTLPIALSLIPSIGLSCMLLWIPRHPSYRDKERSRTQSGCIP